MKKVAIVMGSDSDLPIIKKAAQVLKDFGVPTELRVLSAHRCAAEVSEFARNAEKNGTGVIIAAAGKAAHLAGAIAGQTPLPVIGIPIKASALEGIDALLSTVQMPAGVPVVSGTLKRLQRNQGIPRRRYQSQDRSLLNDKVEERQAHAYI